MAESIGVEPAAAASLPPPRQPLLLAAACGALLLPPRNADMRSYPEPLLPAWRRERYTEPRPPPCSCGQRRLFTLAGREQVRRAHALALRGDGGRPGRLGGDTAEIQPRYSRDTAEIQPRFSRDSAEIQPRFSRGMAAEPAESAELRHPPTEKCWVLTAGALRTRSAPSCSPLASPQRTAATACAASAPSSPRCRASTGR